MPGTPIREIDALTDAHSAAWWSLEFARHYQRYQCARAFSLSGRFRALHRMYVAAARLD